MASFGDALRGYASVLNPQVAQQVAQEDAQNRALQNQLGMVLLQNKLKQQDPAYQAQVQALQNQKLFQQAAIDANGDMAKIAQAAVQYGKPELAVNLFNQSEARATRLQQARDQLQARQDMLQMQLEQKTLDRDQRARADAQMAELKRQGLSLQAEIAKSNADLKRMQFQFQSDQQLVKQTNQLGVALEKAKLPEADAVLGQVESLFGDDPVKAKEIASYVAGPNSWRPDLTVPQNIRDARQAAVKLFNITLRDRSGAAVTNQELERLKQEFATGVWKTPEQFLNGIKRAREIINKHYSSVAAGYGRKALEAYNENLRGLGGKVVISPVEEKTVDFNSLK